MKNNQKKAESEQEMKETQNNLPPVLLHTQYIKDMSLEIPHAPEIFREMVQAPKVDVHVDVDARHMHDNFHNVSLKFRLTGDLQGKNLFLLELEYAAVISLNVPEEHVKPILMIEIPRMLFPFVRSIIANIMIDGGLPPVMLNPIDFGALFQNREQNMKKQ